MSAAMVPNTATIITAAQWARAAGVSAEATAPMRTLLGRSQSPRSSSWRAGNPMPHPWRSSSFRIQNHAVISYRWQGCLVCERLSAFTIATSYQLVSSAGGKHWLSFLPLAGSSTARVFRSFEAP
jgi:hypothetical protein